VELTEISTTIVDADHATVEYLEKVIAQDGNVEAQSEQVMQTVRVDGVWYISMTDTILSAIESLAE
jgi:hypothetical protein